MFFLKDPTIFSNWLIRLFNKTNFWKHKIIIKYIWYLIYYIFQYYFKSFNIYGIKIKFKGKISAGGNSRTKKIIIKYGLTNSSSIKYKNAYDFNLIYTFTGVIGYQIWLFF